MSQAICMLGLEGHRFKETECALSLRAVKTWIKLKIRRHPLLLG
jgi:hypothetical protein